jgi:cobalt transporter subunit CbtB
MKTKTQAATADAVMLPVAVPAARRDAVTAASVALVAGLMLVFTVGFAHPELLHNAAHDWRHSMSFPCH